MILENGNVLYVCNVVTGSDFKFVYNTDCMKDYIQLTHCRLIITNNKEHKAYYVNVFYRYNGVNSEVAILDPFKHISHYINRNTNNVGNKYVHILLYDEIVGNTLVECDMF